MAQIAPVWLNKSATIDRIKEYIIKAAKDNCELIVFGEALLPGYPFWVSMTDGAKFDSKVQKEIHAHYVKNSVQIEAGELDDICALAKQHKIAIYLGLMERAQNRGGHSIYCSLAYIDNQGEIKSVHRKLQPTYEERLTWAPGDGNGLQVHNLKNFSVGGLNCWENWMPLPRATLYGLGENLHIAVWPGSDYNTANITRFIARESRSFVVSVSSLMSKTDFPDDTPHLNAILENCPETLANGGSCIAGPDGEWILPPVIDKEGLITTTIDFNRVLEERQNFDPVGHYSRPDVTKLSVNRERQSTIEIKD
ncbi:carbon-nitrogen hydrolase family protein [Maribacter sp. 1_2014MBL_MicDiv]|uniref:carbon-nitrogen hydrolase family protein n=1 Tax=Maribacter sp. 1_2014MBL_MicDiv TaxID=1644130 RepID=UPI0008F4728A|nr:carbon-nitrogen hydrolase family protein [Maribacter sp. 1_2014MBL_MicDiv]APA66191.1 carbon-nitrogen hydrolase [Maribacter sp. 1_2014MBL_MicDiv]